MFTPNSPAQAPLKALSMIPHMSDNQLKQIAMDTKNPISTFAIAALNSRQIDKTKAATMGAQNAPTIANQVMSKETAPGINMLPNNMPQQMMPQGVTQLAQNETPQQPIQQMAQGGVATLDTGDMYDEKNYAGGGIVAFDGGGDVRHYATGDYVLPPDYSPENYWSMAQAQLKGDRGISGLPATKYMGIKTPYDAAIQYYDSLGTQEALNARDKLQMEKYKWLRSSTDPTQQMEDTGMGSQVNRPINKLPTLDTTPLNKSVAETKPAKEDNAAAPAKEEKKTIDFTKDTDFKPPAPPTSDDDISKLLNVDTYKKRPEDLTEGKRAMEDYKKLAGDNEFLPELQKRAEKREKELEESKRIDPWMALAEAGLSMYGGTSPYANVNIGQGAATGFKSYAEAKKEQSKLDDKLFDINAKIADAHRQEQLAAAKYGTESMQYNKAANDRYALEKEKGLLDIQKYKYLDPSRAVNQLASQSNNRVAKEQELIKSANIGDLYMKNPDDYKDNPALQQAIIKAKKTYKEEIVPYLDKYFPISTDPNAFRANAPAATPRVNPFLYGVPYPAS